LEKRRKRIIIASILLHLLFFLLWEAGIIMDLFSDKVKIPAKEIESPPLVFQLQEPASKMPHEVVETPEDAKVVEKQEKADFLSDKNALARSPETKPDLKEGEAFSQGVYESHELPTQPGNQGQTQEPPQPKTPEEKEKPAEPEQEVEPLEMALNRFQPPTQLPPGFKEHPPSVLHRNLDSSTDDVGGLSFNTYDWDFAPYLLELKRRIQRNIFPPPAFTYLGLITGQTLLRFKIFPNGQMKDLEVLD